MKRDLQYSILITGASSGIGEALAITAARRGATALFLCGRNRERLDAIANRCKALGCEKVYHEIIDVADKDSTASWISRCDAIAPLEIVFANAGIATGKENTPNIRKTFDVNIGGCLNTVLPVIDIFKESPSNRKRRQIALTASMAAYAPLSTCPAYSATKAAVKTWGLSLRGMLKRDGIAVNVICPGFVRSRITDRNTCPMPFFMEADKAATIIINRLLKNIGLIAFPWQMRFPTWWLSTLHWRIAEIISSLLPEKNGDNRDTEK